MLKMNKENFLYSIALAVVIFALRFAFFADEKTDFSSDTGHYAIASEFYSIQDYAPHLPGYFLYVKLIKVVSFLTGSPQSAMKWLSLLFSVAGSLFLFRIARNYTGEKASFLLALLIMTNPFVWFFGCNNEIYTFDLFFSAAIVFAGLNNKWIYSTPPILALGMGIRLSSAVLLLPVVVYLWYNHNKKQGIYWARFFEFTSLAVVLLLMWLIPMFRSAGGIGKYIALYDTHYPFIPSGVLYNLSNFIGYAWYILLPFASIAAFAGYMLFRGKPISWKEFKENNSKELFTAIYWLAPALIVFTFFNYQKGYFLLAAGALFLLYILWYKQGLLKNSIVIAVILIQSALFFAMPYSEPPDELNFTAQARSFGREEAWAHRLVSGFSMGAQRIAAYDGYYSDIHKGIKETNELIKVKKKYFYMFDPSCLVFARGFQALMPSQTFCVLNNYDMRTYFSYNEYELRKTTDPYYMIKNAIIISRKSFYEKYLKGIAAPIKEYDTYVFLDGNEINGIRLLQIYTDLYDEREDKEKE